jgi:hypothetical protein
MRSDRWRRVKLRITAREEGRKQVRLLKEEGNGVEKAREWLTFMEWSVVNVSHRKPHDMITSARKSTPRESQNLRGLRVT